MSQLVRMSGEFYANSRSHWHKIQRSRCAKWGKKTSRLVVNTGSYFNGFRFACVYDFKIHFAGFGHERCFAFTGFLIRSSNIGKCQQRA